MLTVVSLLVATVVLAAQPSVASSSTARYRLRTAAVPGVPHAVLRWNPCAGPISWRVNVNAIRGRAAKRAAIVETAKSFARMAKVTRLRFAYRGTTSYIPQESNSYSPAQIVVAFVRPGQTSYNLAGNIAGEGGTWYSWSTTAGSSVTKVWSTTGYAVIDEPQTRNWSKSMTRAGVTRPNIILHELGHVMGLDHVSSARELMNPTLNRLTPGGHFGPGDRIALRSKVGASAGC